MGAVRTLGRLLACVCPHVLPQIGAIIKSPITQITFERLHSLMFDGVQPKVVAARELLTADVAHVRFRSVMDVHMTDQIILVVE